MRKKIVVGLFAVLVLAFIILVLLPKPKENIISVITYVDHPVLNTIEQSFDKRFKEIIGDSIKTKILRSNAQGSKENLPNICKQALSQNPDIVLTISTPVTQALMRAADNEQKIVYTFVTNPSDLGNELTRTNSTGLSDAVNYSANIELIQRIFGKNISIGMLYNPNEPNSVSGIQTVESLIENTPTKLVKAAVYQETDIPDVVSKLASSVKVIYVGGDNTVVGAMPAVIKSALDKKIPVFASDSGSIENGAIAGISVDYVKLGQQTAEVVSEVLKGKEPRAIPRIILQGDILIVNKRAAALWDFTIPQWMKDEAKAIIGDKSN